MNLSLVRKGIVLLAVPLLYQLALIGLFSWLQIRSAEAQRQSNRAKQVIAQNRAISAQGREVVASLIDAETGIRGYIIAATPEFREPYDRARNDVPTELERLANMTRDNSAQAEQVARIRDKASLALEWLAQTEQLVKASKQREAFARTIGGEGKQRMDELRAEVTAFLDTMATALEEEERGDAERTATLVRVQRYSLAALLGGGFAAFGLTALLAVIFRRAILRRFDLLVENTHRLAEGRELSSPIVGIDEIADLDSAFRSMADRLRRAETDRRQASEEIHRFNADLERRVRERTAELAEVNRDLLLKNQENETFVYSVSHDLRSPLVNLEGFSQELGLVSRDLRALLIGDDVPPDVQRTGLSMLNGSMAESIRFIQTAVRRLSTIIDALLRLSRAGRLEYERQELDATALARRVADSMHATAAARKATIEIGELPRLRGDAAAIEQVFANLIGNALNYLDSARPGRVEVGCLPDTRDGLRTCYVRDNGVGIPEDCREKIFQAFHRLHPEAASGEGMGLTIVRRIVERHRGTAWVESQVGVGSTFFVALPASSLENHIAKPGAVVPTRLSQPKEVHA